jgi:hypothetical protein
MKDTLHIWAVTLAAVLGSGGCSTMKEAFTNRVVCTVAQDKSFVASMWGIFGIVTPLADLDHKQICAPKAPGEVK